MRHPLLEQAVFLTINHWAIDPVMASVWQWLSTLGNGAIAVVIIAAAGGLSRRSMRRVHVAIGLCLPTGALVVHLIKIVFDAPRPLAVLHDAVIVVGPALTRNAFVSGHALTAAATAVLICAMLQRRIAAVPIVLLAMAVAIARVVVGAHWPVDVVSGFALGAALGATGWWVTARMSWRMQSALAAVGVVLVLTAFGVILFGGDAELQANPWGWRLACLLAIGVWTGGALLRGPDPLRRMSGAPTRAGRGPTIDSRNWPRGRGLPW